MSEKERTGEGVARDDETEVSQVEKRINTWYSEPDNEKYTTLGLILWFGSLVAGCAFQNIYIGTLVPISFGVFCLIHDVVVSWHNAEATVVDRSAFPVKVRGPHGSERIETRYHVTVHFDYGGRAYSCRLDCKTDNDTLTVFVDPKNNCLVTGTKETVLSGQALLYFLWAGFFWLMLHVELL